MMATGRSCQFLPAHSPAAWFIPLREQTGRQCPAMNRRGCLNKMKGNFSAGFWLRTGIHPESVKGNHGTIISSTSFSVSLYAEILAVFRFPAKKQGQSRFRQNRG